MNELALTLGPYMKRLARRGIYVNIGKDYYRKVEVSLSKYTPRKVNETFTKVPALQEFLKSLIK